MAATILGISGSPVRNSNTDRAVQAVLAASGLDSEFIKLSQMTIEPCRACLGCKENNMCVVRDDARELAVKFRDARAFVIGAFTPYSSLDSRTKAFMERMYCLRHQTGLNAGKIGASVITSAVPPGKTGLPPAAQTAASQIEFSMLEEGMVGAGTMVVMGNVPCIKCGHGDECAMSGIAMLHGDHATVESVGVNHFEDDPRALKAAEQLGTRIRKMLEAVPVNAKA